MANRETLEAWSSLKVTRVKHDHRDNAPRRMLWLPLSMKATKAHAGGFSVINQSSHVAADLKKSTKLERVTVVTVEGSRICS